LAYKVTYKKSVESDLKRLSPNIAKRILDRIDEKLSSNPKSFPPLTGELKGLRKLSVGDYRVIFAVIGNEVQIIRIGHRKDVYR
jgi:mRNA interferase RelE/StbE